MNKKFLLAIFCLITTIFIFSSCDKPVDADIPDGVDIDLINKVSDSFDEIFLLYNDKKFDEYVNYYLIDDEQKQLMLDGLNANSEFYDSKYEIRNVYASYTDDGNINATIVYYAISTNTNGDSTIIEETMYYNLIENDGKISILSYEAGPANLVE